MPFEDKVVVSHLAVHSAVQPWSLGGKEAHEHVGSILYPVREGLELWPLLARTPVEQPSKRP